MAKWQNDLMLDAALNYIKDNVGSVVLCDSQPVDYAEATTLSGSGGKRLALIAAAGADFLEGDGDISGRKIIVPQISDVTVEVTGVANHVAIVSATDLLYVTTCVDQSLTVGNLVTIPAWDIELRDAS